MRFLLCLCAICALCGESFSASPSLGSVQPRGAQRGTEVALTFNGARLNDAQEVLVYYPGVTVKKLEVVSPAQLKVTVAIAPDCRLGEHAFRVRTATGVSDLRTFWVRRFRRLLPAALITLLLVVFMGYVGIRYNALVGRDCSCFPWLKRAVNAAFFFEDGAMLAASVAAGLFSRKPGSLRVPI